MAKKQKQPTKTCADCIHESACRVWTDGRAISDASASQCPSHETVKESGAYLCGVLDERKRKQTNGDRIRAMSDAEGDARGTREARNVPESIYPDGDMDTPECPRCGSGEYLTNEDGNKNAFCGQCGQALDWDEPEEVERCEVCEAPFVGNCCPVCGWRC